MDNPAAARLTDEVPVSLITWRTSQAQRRIIKMCVCVCVCKSESERDAVIALAG